MTDPVEVLRGRLSRVIRYGRRSAWALEIVSDQLNWCEGERQRLLARLAEAEALVEIHAAHADALMQSKRRPEAKLADAERRGVL
jgi:hypothetical protein